MVGIRKRPDYRTARKIDMMEQKAKGCHLKKLIALRAAATIAQGRLKTTARGQAFSDDLDIHIIRKQTD